MLIGMCGAAGSGKDTIADILGFDRVAFADPLYEMVAIITGMTPDEMRDRETKEREIDWLGHSPRQLLQTLGTEWGRDTISPTIWVDTAMRRVRGLLEQGRSVVVTDVRFDNEAAAIKAAGGVIWQVVRGQGSIKGLAARHASEGGVDPLLIDRVLGNWSTIERLRQTVEAAIDGQRKATILE
jgi:hypothetical protein